MTPDFNIVDEALVKLYLAERDYQLAKRNFRNTLTGEGYISHTFGTSKNHTERLIHSSVNPHQIDEFGDINEYLNQQLAIDI